MPKFKRKHWVTIVYKSGAKVHVKAAAFSVTHRGGDVTKVSWDAAPIVHVGVGEIAAVFAGRV